MKVMFFSCVSAWVLPLHACPYSYADLGPHRYAVAGKTIGPGIPLESGGGLGDAAGEVGRRWWGA